MRLGEGGREGRGRAGVSTATGRNGEMAEEISGRYSLYFGGKDVLRYVAKRGESKKTMGIVERESSGLGGLCIRGRTCT